MLQFTIKLNLTSGQFGGLFASKTPKTKILSKQFHPIFGIYAAVTSCKETRKTQCAD